MPLSPVVAWRLTPVGAWTTASEASATLAPVWSVTVPRTDARCVWLPAVDTAASAIATTMAHTRMRTIPGSNQSNE